MTKVRSHISKIEQILQSENCEAGFELLRTKNDSAEKYYEENDELEWFDYPEE